MPLTILLTPEEETQIHQKAAAQGVGAAEYARQILTDSLLPAATRQSRERNAYAAQINAFLAASDGFAAQVEGEFDSVEELMRIREERGGRA